MSGPKSSTLRPGPWAIGLLNLLRSRIYNQNAIYETLLNSEFLYFRIEGVIYLPFMQTIRQYPIIFHMLVSDRLSSHATHKLHVLELLHMISVCG